MDGSACKAARVIAAVPAARTLGAEGTPANRRPGFDIDTRIWRRENAEKGLRHDALLSASADTIERTTPRVGFNLLREVAPLRVSLHVKQHQKHLQTALKSQETHNLTLCVASTAD